MKNMLKTLMLLIISLFLGIILSIGVSTHLDNKAKDLQKVQKATGGLNK